MSKPEQILLGVVLLAVWAVMWGLFAGGWEALVLAVVFAVGTCVVAGVGGWLHSLVSGEEDKNPGSPK